MLARFEALTQKVEQLCKNSGDKRLSKWLDNGDVCRLLNIKKRRLQTYRDTGKIAYSKIGNVILYRPEDVMNFINQGK